MTKMATYGGIKNLRGFPLGGSQACQPCFSRDGQKKTKEGTERSDTWYRHNVKSVHLYRLYTVDCA
jgi:hypothetical protein